jgi:hypothetical protein
MRAPRARASNLRRYDEAPDFAGAFVDFGDASVAIVALEMT